MKRIVIAGVVATFCLGVAVWNSATASPPIGKGLPQMPGAPVVSGTVYSREHIELPGMAMLHLELIDASAKDARSASLGVDTAWVAGGKLPIDFRMAYDPSRIDPTHTYIIRARIMDGEKVLLMNTIPYHVLTRGAPSKVDIVVVPAQVRIR